MQGVKTMEYILIRHMRNFLKFIFLVVLSLTVSLSVLSCGEKDIPPHNTDQNDPSGDEPKPGDGDNPGENPETAEIKQLEAWLENIQLKNGLLTSVESGNNVSLYDNALAALAFIATGHYDRAEAILDYFNSRVKSELCNGTGGYYQFRSVNGVPSGNRWLGDNAWLLIAINNYAAKVDPDRYSTMQKELDGWIRSLQDTDGGLWGGTDGAKVIAKNTEGMIDAYCAVCGYDDFHKNLLSHLRTKRYDNRDGLLVSWPGNKYKYALDNHSWGYCTFEDFPTSVLDKASMYLNTQKTTVGGITVTGFAPDIDRDIVWLEGTGQMVVAYRKAGDKANADKYLAEMKKTLIPSRAYENCSGLPYSSNPGTTYGSSQLWTGADTNICVSSTTWYIFALLGFDPMEVTYSRGTPAADKFWL